MSKRKLRATVARSRGTAHVSQSVWYEASPNVHALDGVLMHNDRRMRNAEPNKRDTNANRKNGGYSTYYVQHEGWGQNNPSNRNAPR